MQKIDLSHTNTWIFDLDDTLYSPECGILKSLQDNILPTIQKQTGMSEAEVQAKLTEYRAKYGFSFPGLRHDLGLDMEEFAKHCFNVDLSAIKPCNQTLAQLEKLPGRRVVFTNSVAHHAEKVLAKLGYSHLFEQIFDATQFDYHTKPAPHIYDYIVAQLGVNPKHCVMVEDSHKNLAPAHALGMTTVLVHAQPPSEGEHVQHYFPTILDFLKAANS